MFRGAADLLLKDVAMNDDTRARAYRGDEDSFVGQQGDGVRALAPLSELVNDLTTSPCKSLEGNEVEPH